VWQGKVGRWRWAQGPGRSDQAPLALPEPFATVLLIAGEPKPPPSSAALCLRGPHQRRPLKGSSCIGTVPFNLPHTLNPSAFTRFPRLNSPSFRRSSSTLQREVAAVGKNCCSVSSDRRLAVQPFLCSPLREKVRSFKPW
jgi:hypothetical protein